MVVPGGGIVFDGFGVWVFGFHADRTQRFGTVALSHRGVELLSRGWNSPTAPLRVLTLMEFTDARKVRGRRGLYVAGRSMAIRGDDAPHDIQTLRLLSNPSLLR